MDYYNKDIKEVLSFLNTSESGLSNEEVKNRLRRYGLNELKKANKLSALKIFLSQFTNRLILLLIGAGLISLFLGSINDSIVIFCIVFLNAIVGFFQEYNAEKAMQALKKMLSKTTKVIRDRNTCEVDVKEVVPGDIILLEEGQHVPADARLIKVVHLKIDEATLTGESGHVHKQSEKIKEETVKINKQSNMVFMGTNVVSGRAIAAVTSTGMNTEFGKIAELTTETETKKSPLQIEMDGVGNLIAKAMVVICLIVFIYGLFVLKYGFAKMFFYAIALAVAIVPEGLPATITISLAMGVKRIAKKNAIIRKLSSVETLGCTTVICTDKTGTITHNQMDVEQIYANNKFININSKEFSYKHHELAIRISVLCNNAIFSDDKYLGDPTEVALVMMAEKKGIGKLNLEQKYKRISEIPFDSERKMMSTINLVGKKKIVHVKGSSHEVLKRCNYINVEGKIKKLNKKEKNILIEKNREMAEKALRVLALAYKEYKDEKYAEENLIFAGFVGMMDLPREDVAEAVRLSKEAGIKAIMITGDQRTTAKAIGLRIGLISKDDEIISGDDLDSLSDDELAEKVKSVKIFARTTPNDKMRIINALRKNKEIIAMTGDGVNDAPALKKSDIGVAMGITGTDVSKEASKMVLTDDSFSTIVMAVKEGRAIYDNIKKFVLYALSGISAELFCVLTSLFSGFPLPLLAVQILWIDLGTEVLPALSLGLDKPEKDVLKRKPRDIEKKIMDKEMIGNILRFSIWETIVTMIMFIYFLKIYGEIKAQTVAFTMIVLFQLFNIFNARHVKESIFRKETLQNVFTLGAVLISFIMQVVVVQTPLFNSLFHTVPLTSLEWINMLLLASTIIWIEEIRKLFLKLEKPNIYHPAVA